MKLDSSEPIAPKVPPGSAETFQRCQHAKTSGHLLEGRACCHIVKKVV